MSDARLRERVAELEGLLDNERLYTAEHRGYAQVVGEENKLLREQLDAARDPAETQRRIATIRENVEHVARGCRASTGHNPAPYLNSIEAALDALARAALGVVGEPNDG